MTHEPYGRLACDRRIFLKEAALALAVLSWPAVSLGETLLLNRSAREGTRDFADPLWIRENIKLMWSERKRTGPDRDNTAYTPEGSVQEGSAPLPEK